MPTRRQHTDQPQFRQGAFASSSDHDRGMMGNLVAERCQRFSDVVDIEVYWWLQQVSWRAGSLDAFAVGFLDTYRDRIGTPSMHMFGMRNGQIYSADQVRTIRREMEDGPDAFLLKGEHRASLADYLPCKPTDFSVDASLRNSHPSSYPASAVMKRCSIDPHNFANHIRRALVDPASRSLRENLWNFPTLWEALLQYRQREIAAVETAIVETAVTRQVFEELDYAMEGRKFILIEGREGVGKTEAARNWCARHPGRVVYVQLESGADEQTLYRSISRCVGTSCSYGRKAKEMRARIQDALQTGQLMLVLDEAHYLWPLSARSERSVPKHAEWVRTALVDKGVPVALISTPQFFDEACERFRKSGWNSLQLRRRLARTVRLPDSLEADDALLVAKRYFPATAQPLLKRIAGVALLSVGYLTTMAHLRSRVDFLSSRRPGHTEPDIIAEALAELAPAAATAPSAREPMPAPCKAGADRVQSPRMPAETGNVRAVNRPASLSFSRREQPALISV